MAATLISQDPSPGSQLVGLRPFIRVALGGTPTSPLVQPDITLSVGGRFAVISGVVQPSFDATFLANGSSGLDVAVRPKVAFEPNEWIGVRVVAADLDLTWTFRVFEAIGPRLVGITPTLAEDSQPSFPLIQFDIVDDIGSVVQRTLSTESNLGSRSGSQLTVSDIDFTGTLGRVVEIAGVPAFITNVVGPNTVFVSTTGSGTGLNVKLFAANGLDVTIHGTKVISSGELVASTEWGVTLTNPASGQWRVIAQKKTTAISAGTRVEIMVRAQDNNALTPNVVDLPWFFYVGDRGGPRVCNLTVQPDMRGLATATTLQPVFDILDASAGINKATVNVRINGTSAISNGTPTGSFSTSTVNAVSGGFRVTLIRGTSWPSVTEQFITIDATDNAGNVMQTVTWIWQHGTAETLSGLTTGTGDVNNISIQRVQPFDLSKTSFGDPVHQKHNGFAFDGFKYANGFKLSTRASWATESTSADRSARDEFPLCGWIITDSSGWSIVDLVGKMWMRCARLVSGVDAEWNAAGNTVASVDAAVAADYPLFAVTSGKFIIAIDFSRDQMWRLTSSGRELAAVAISGRAGNLGGQSPDSAYALTSSTSSFIRLAVYAKGNDWLIAGGRFLALEMTGSMPDMAVAATIARGPGGNFAAHTTVLSMASQDIQGNNWGRIRLQSKTPDKLMGMLIAGHSTGILPRLVVADWLSVWAYLQGAIKTFDENNSSLVTAQGLVDVDQVVDRDGRWLLCLGQRDRVHLCELSSNGQTLTSFDELDYTEMTLSTVAGSTLIGACLDPGFERGNGFLFAGCAAASDGKVVRWRHQPTTASSTGRVVTLHSGAKMTSLGAIGTIRCLEERFIRASLVMTTISQQFIRAGVEVEA